MLRRLMFVMFAVTAAAAFAPADALAGSQRFANADDFRLETTIQNQVGAVPEPTAALAFAAGALVVGIALRRRR